MNDGPFKLDAKYKQFVHGPGISVIKGTVHETNVEESIDDWDSGCGESHVDLMNRAWHSRDSEMTSKDARIKELEAERDKYKKSSLCSRQRIASMLHVWELRDKEAYRSNAGDELRAVVSLLDEALGGE